MKTIFLLLLTLSLSLFADAVYTKTYNAPIAKIMALFDYTHLIVVSKIDILAKFKAAGLPQKFGKNFNTNKLSGIKAIIACNGWFGNEVANADPKMMAFCPVRVTLIERDAKTTVTYVRATVAAKGSKAYSTLERLETKVIKAIERL